MDQYGFVKKNKGDYLVWIGRVSPKKGAIIAIQAAKKAGIRLEMAAAIDPIDRAYFDAEIKPHIDGNNVVYHGEIGQKALVELYSGALATLYPISWHEPFGLVMVESMATGTPVIAFNIGSVPEIIRDGLNGFVLDPSAGVDGFTNAIANVDKLNRDAVRESVEVQFHVERMVTDYERVYESVIAK
jgi:glycosyltransferase involved in cell wall biosynthesis